MNKPLLFFFFIFLSAMKVRAQLPQIYIHTDRSIYSPGDTIWFKGYLMNNVQLDTSKNNLYINWGKADGVVEQCNVYFVDKGISFSQFVIPTNYTANTLLINAFTSDIIDNPELGYMKRIFIVQNRNAKDVVNEQMLVATVNNSQLVQGLKNSVYLRGEDKSGQGFGYTAELVDANFNILQTVEADSLGLSSFSFIPQQGKYAIRWRTSKSLQKVIELPEVLAKGIVGELVTKPDSFILKLTSSDVNLSNVLIKTTYNQQLLKEEEVALVDGQVSLEVAMSDLRFGLLQFYVFDTSGNRIATIEKVIDDEEVMIEPVVEFVTKNGTPKGKQEIVISIPGALEANLSVSVSDIVSYPDASDHFSNAVLGTQSSDFNISNKPSKHLNILENTVSWKDLTAVVQDISNTPDSLLYIKGKVLMSEKKWREYDDYIAALNSGKKKSKYFFDKRDMSLGYRPVKDGSESIPFYHTSALLKPDRTFTYQPLQFFDTMEFRLSHVHKYSQYTDVDVNYSFKPFEDNKTMIVPKVFEDTLTFSFLDFVKMDFPNGYKRLQQSINLDIVDVHRNRKSRKVLVMEKKLRISTFFERSIFDFFPQEDAYVKKYSSSIEHVIKTNRELSRFPLTYINEKKVKFYSGEQINEILSQDAGFFAFARVLPNNSLAIYTFSPEEVRMNELGRNILFRKVMGYTKIENIVNKVYQDEKDTSLDNRIRLYWHPLVILDPEKKEFKLDFYNNDYAKGYWITIKGITSDGRLIDYSKKVVF